jgi:photosystem II stability/assembly factor-like uncharacterized protein
LALSARPPTAFISYSREDSEFALRLTEDLKAAGAGVWLDQLDIEPGQEWDSSVENALIQSPRVILILSPSSAMSSNVRNEISFALDEKKTIIPVLHRDCAVPLQLRRIQYVDFRTDYVRGFKVLLAYLGGRKPDQDISDASSRVPEESTPGRFDTDKHQSREPEVAQRSPEEQETGIRAAIEREAQERLGAAQVRAKTESKTTRQEDDALPRRPLSRLPRPPVWMMIVGALAGLLVVWLAYYALTRTRPSEPAAGPEQAVAPSGGPVTTVPPISQPVKSQMGWAVGERGTILHTEDGGITWKKQDGGTDHHLNEVTFSTPQLGWVAGDWGTLLRTKNGGDTWENKTIDRDLIVSSVTFVTSRLGWVSGTNAIFHSEDGGDTWKKQFSGAGPYLDLGEVTFATPLLGWAVGDKGLIFHTDDGGVVWKRQDSGVRAVLLSVAFNTPQSGWVTGYDGVILHTEDGGNTWKKRASGTQEGLYSITFATSQSGWIIGSGGIILHTEDGRSVWKKQTSGVNVILHSVKFVTPESGWAVGERGTILHTDDGGNTWKNQESGTSEYLHSVSVAGPQP